jgi:hypothetical protein
MEPCKSARFSARWGVLPQPALGRCEHSIASAWQPTFNQRGRNTAKAAGNAMSASVPPVVAFQTLIPMPGTKKPYAMVDKSVVSAP